MAIVGVVPNKPIFGNMPLIKLGTNQEFLWIKRSIVAPT